MGSHHIEIRKVIEVKPKGYQAEIVNPLKSSPDTRKWKVVNEVIELPDIRSFREWKKDDNMAAQVSGDVTILYMHGIKDPKKDDKGNLIFPSIIIEESYQSFLERSRTIPLPSSAK